MCEQIWIFSWDESAGVEERVRECGRLLKPGSNESLHRPEELEEINAPRYLAVSMWGTGGARESDWMGRSRKGAQDSHKHGSVAVTVLDRDLGRVR